MGLNLKLSPNRFSGGMQPPPAKGPFFIFLLMMPAFLFLIVLLLVAMQYKQLRSFVAPKPMEMTTVPESAEAQEQAHARVQKFFTAAPGAASAQAPGTTAAASPGSATASASDTLVISTEEINHLTRSSQALSDMHLDYHLELQDTLLIARNSLPVNHLNGYMATMARLMRIKGFLNSEMKARPDFNDSALTLIPVSAVMNGQAAPVSVLGGKGKFNVRDWISDKDFYDKALAGLSEVKIRGGKLLLIKKH